MTAEPLLEQFAPGVRMTVPAPAPAPGPSPARSASPPAHAHPFAVSAALAAAGAGPTACRRRLAARCKFPLSRLDTVEYGSMTRSRALHPESTGTDATLAEPDAKVTTNIGGRAQPQPDAAPGRGAPAHHVLHDAGPLRDAAGRLEPRAVRLPLAPAALPGSDLTFDRLSVVIDARGRLLVGGRSRWTRRPRRRGGPARRRLAAAGPRDAGRTRPPGPTSCRPS